jgi:hypothetical protein
VSNGKLDTNYTATSHSPLTILMSLGPGLRVGQAPQSRMVASKYARQVAIAKSHSYS